MTMGISDLERNLHILTRGLSAAMAVVVVATVVAASLVLWQIGRIADTAAPAREAATHLELALERVEAAQSSTAATTDLRTLKTAIADSQATIADCAAAMSDLRRLGVRVSPGLADQLTRLNGDLATVVRARIDAIAATDENSRIVATAVEKLIVEIGDLGGVTRARRRDAQVELEDARATSHQANDEIHRLMALRDGLRELRIQVVQPAQITNRYRLRPLEDRVSGILDTLRARLVPTQPIDAEMITALAKIETTTLNTTDGLLSLRAKQLADPAAPQIATAFQECSRAILAGIDQWFTRIVETIDPLELTVAKAERDMEIKVTAIADCTGLELTTRDVALSARSLSSLVGLFPTTARLDEDVRRFQARVADLLHELHGHLAMVSALCSRLGLAEAKASAETIAIAVNSLEPRLNGEAGIAASVSRRIVAATAADLTIAHVRTALLLDRTEAIRSASEARLLQEISLRRVEMALKAGVPVLLVLCLAALIGGNLLSRRVSRGILAAQHQLQNEIAEKVSSESLSNTIVNAAREGIWMNDEEARITFVNQRMAEMLGYEPTEMTGRTLYEFMHADDAASAKGHFVQLQMGIGEQYDFRLRHRSGRDVWTIFSTSPVYDAGRHFVGSLALVTDITIRRIEESGLRRLHADTELLVSSITSVLIGVDARGCVCRWNDVAKITFNRTTSDVEGRLLADLQLPWDNAEIDATVRRCLESGQASHTEVRGIRYADSSEAIFDVIVCPSQQRSNAGLRYVLLAADVTESKLLAVQRAQGQKLEAIGQLSAGVAHEINTPVQFIGDNLRFLTDAFRDLTSVLACHRQLREIATTGSAVAEAVTAATEAERKADVDYLLEEGPKALSQGLEGVERIATIVRALKEFSHPDSATMSAVNLAQSIQSTLIVARSEYKYVADVVTEFDPELPPVRCMQSELNQVILNLVINAAHAIADVVGKNGGRGTITVSVKQTADQAEIRIGDTGTGIPEAIRGKIFDPFFTTKPVGKGTGQGLHIAHEIVVKRHGGTIDLESEVGKGTTFIIRIPIAGIEGN